MKEQIRREEAFFYEFLNSTTQQGLDEITEIASVICDTPIALITILDNERQWFKAKIGLDISETSRKDSFCQYAIDNPHEVLVVNEPLTDERFMDNPLVTGDPNIRFYAGAPLVTSDGNMLGTLCVIDTQPRTITEKQKEALKLLAKRTAYSLDAKTLLIDQKENIEMSAQKLKNLTDHVPGIIFQFEMTATGKMSVSFVSQGVSEFYPALSTQSLRTDPQTFMRFIHPEDLQLVRKAVKESYETLIMLQVDYRVATDSERVIWHRARARPERMENDTVVWYGTIHNVTAHVEYKQAMEQIAFDISHVLRRPVTSLLGLASLIHEDDNIDQQKLREYMGYIKTVSSELDDFTRKLAEVYALKKKLITGQTNE